MGSQIDLRPTQPLRCSGCAYVLEGLPENRCPECGARFDPVQLRAQQAGTNSLLTGAVITAGSLVVAVVVIQGLLEDGSFWDVVALSGVPFIAAVGPWVFVRAILAAASVARFPEALAWTALHAMAMWLMPGIVWSALTMADARGKSLANLIEPLFLGFAAGVAFIFVVELRGVGHRNRWLSLSAIAGLAVMAFLVWGLVPSLPE